MHSPNPQPTAPESHYEPLPALTPQQLQAAHLLTSGHRLAEVAQQLQIGRATFYRWRQQPAFAAYLHELQQDAADEARCQALYLLTQSQALIQQTLLDPATPLPLRLKLSFRLLSLYSRPSYLQSVHQLPTNPLEVEDQQMRQTMQNAGDSSEYRSFPPEERMLYRQYQARSLQQAQALDQAYPDPAALIAPVLAKLNPQHPTPAAQPTPARDRMRHPETAHNTGAALDAALSGLRQQIAKATQA
jgi:Helix-turn-helix of insertion element transposase